MNIFPTTRQWANWKMPTKLGYISAWLAFIALIFSILVFIFSKISESEKDKISELRYQELLAGNELLLAEIKKTRPEDASEELKKEVKTAEERIRNPETADDFYLKAYAADVDENYDMAITHYNKVIELDPGYASAYFNLGFLYMKKDIFKKENLDKAKKYLEKAIKLEPSHNNIEIGYKFLGISYYYNNDYDNAIECCKKYLNIKSNANTYYAMGLAYYSKKDYDRALECLKKSIKLDTNCAQAYHGIAMIYLVKIKDEMKNKVVVDNKIVVVDNKIIEMHNKAIYFLKKAAKFGHEPSQEALIDLRIAW